MLFCALDVYSDCFVFNALQIQVRLSEEKDLLQEDKQRITKDLKQFLQPLREKLIQFEQELKDR